MKHFKVATIKLTLVYVALLMGLSLIFSVWLYNAASRELHIVSSTDVTIGVETFEDGLVQASSQRLFSDLLFFNLIVFGGGTLLSYLLARRTLRPIQQNYQLQEEFASNASHQLRTPLTILRGELQLLLRDKERTPAKYEAAAKSSLEEVDRLIDLSTRLLRLSAGAISTEEETGVRGAIQKTLARLRPLIDKKGLTVKKHVSDIVMPMAEADLTEVLGIILDNAIKYSPSKGVIELGAKVQDRQMVLFVIDRGPGIAPHDLPHIFERFYRSEQALGEGYGLGLALAQKLVTEAGGIITVESKPGRTRLTISFPA